MSILTSLFTAVSGLDAFGAGLSVVSNNIANMNTVGFKGSDTIFADLISKNLGGSGSSQVGRGVIQQAVRKEFNQGSFETTSNGLDLGIDGDGFFQLRDAQGAVFYSRAGALNIDADGMLVNPDGLRLQGYQADAAGNLTGQVDDINLASTNFPPLSTANISLVANLDSRDAIPPAFDVTDPSATSDFSSGITVYDSLGNSHLVTVYFRKDIEAATGNTWEWFGVVGANDSTSGNAEVQAGGTVTFGLDGTLTADATTTSSFDFSGGATQNLVVAFNFGSSTTSGGNGLDGVTQFGSASTVLNLSQDGYASGLLQGVSVNPEGTITGVFTNGKSRTLAQVALARFNSPEGLNAVGRNLFSVSGESGQPLVGSANSAGLGQIVTNSLEMSNVDLAQQFVKMIGFQRGFQANSRVITTTDQILQELVNLRQ